MATIPRLRRQLLYIAKAQAEPELRLVAYLRNQNGVVIRLDTTTEGLRLNLSASGVATKVPS